MYVCIYGQTRKRHVQEKANAPLFLCLRVFPENYREKFPNSFLIRFYSTFIIKAWIQTFTSNIVHNGLAL